ncbi:thiamine pyrophosphate-binding protein [Neomicrococcus aestuarii]|uniref:Thiamine pyrophosphate-binding protein n=1 Tax=Neomicrococcus aestuarii TaxID=556325 RepID=A0A1L2ZMD0_9MICC|nr:thiamine pyrophosphate-binding protein [Neomicrococcus aestuarii]APF40181.1 thiamine pyrophosphate-binding protein [Neomicrococcus aestuarii]
MALSESTDSQVISVSDAIARTLAQYTDAFFGLMGNGNAYFVDALERINTPIFEVRHEVATVASADAYHRVSGKIAVATTTYGAGFTNTLTALAEAAQARIPLILVVGDEPTAGRRPWDVNQEALTTAVGARYMGVNQHDAAAVALRAFVTARDERVPVVLAIPYDISASPFEGVLTVDSLPPVRAVKILDQEHIEHIVQTLLASRNPLILAGRGAKNAATAVRSLASFLGAKVATPAPARGLFNRRSTEDSFVDLGVCGGFAATGAAEEIRGADLVLVMGAGLNQFTRAFGEAFSPEATIIQIDLAPEKTHQSVDYFYQCAIEGAAPQLLQALLDQEAQRITQPETIARVQARRKQASSYSEESDLTRREMGSELAPDGRLDPRALLSELNRLIPKNRTVIVDGGHFIGWPNMFIDLPGADHMVMVGTAYQSIGLGFPSAPGAAVGRPDSLPVLFCGDGGGLMGIADAETFMRIAGRGVVVVMNDAAYGAEVHQYVSKGLAERPVLIPDINFAGMLEALGAQSTVVRRHQDLAAFERWITLEEDGVFVLDCRVSKDVIAPYMRELIA